MGTIASDHRIRFIAQERLLRDKALHLVDVSVHCHAGNLYIAGEHGSPKDRERAVGIARSVDGIRSVALCLLLKKKDDSWGTTDNLAITAKINTRLAGDIKIMSTNVDLKVLRCHAVPPGIVGSKKEATGATAHAGSVSGVQGVTSCPGPGT